MFWDSSALVPFLLPEPRSKGIASLLRGDAQITIWWATPLECQSAMHRCRRQGILAPNSFGQASERLAALIQNAHMVTPTSGLRERAGRLLAGHPLRAADALQLAAALAWCQEQPSEEGFVCLDDRLCEAALREGFTIFPRGPMSPASLTHV